MKFWEGLVLLAIAFIVAYVIYDWTMSTNQIRDADEQLSRYTAHLLVYELK